MFVQIAVAAILLTPCVNAWAADEITLAPGRGKTIVLSENPSTGYTWKIDQEGSENLAILAIVDQGHKRGGSMPGAPGQHRWSLRAKAHGHAILQLVYQRPWEPEPIETRQIKVDVR
jgi:inhibitor of cysteine peptidase